MKPAYLYSASPSDHAEELRQIDRSLTFIGYALLQAGPDDDTRHAVMSVVSGLLAQRRWHQNVLKENDWLMETYDKARVYNLMLGNTLTPDDPRVPVLLAATKDNPDHALLITIILNKRRAYKKWVTVTQRQWQSKVSRRTSRQRHHDSLQIRERYVRCT